MDKSNYKFYVNETLGVTTCVVSREDFTCLVGDYAFQKLYRIMRSDSKLTKIGFAELMRNLVKNYLEPIIDKTLCGRSAVTQARCNFEEDTFSEEYGRILAAKRMDKFVAQTAMKVLEAVYDGANFFTDILYERIWNISTYVGTLKSDIGEFVGE